MDRRHQELPLKHAVNTTAVEASPKYRYFRVIAQMRFVDILHWLKMRKDSNRDVPQKEMKVLLNGKRVTVRKRSKQTREEYL